MIIDIYCPRCDKNFPHDPDSSPDAMAICPYCGHGGPVKFRSRRRFTSDPEEDEEENNNP